MVSRYDLIEAERVRLTNAKPLTHERVLEIRRKMRAYSIFLDRKERELRVKRSGPLTHARLQELLDYNPETGVFTWRVQDMPMRRLNGGRAGCAQTSTSRVVIGVDNKIYRADQLAWFYMTGKYPTREILHATSLEDMRWVTLSLGDRPAKPPQILRR